MIRNGRRLLPVLCLIAALGGCTHEAQSRAQPDAQAAVVDLRHVDFSRGGVVVVPTVWDFYWRRYLSPHNFAQNPPPVPDARVSGMHAWTAIQLKGAHNAAPQSPGGQGFATYRLLLRLPAGREYGFHLQQQLTSFRAYVNGELMVRGGEPGADRRTTRPDRSAHRFYVQTADGNVELILHVANFHLFRGGLRGELSMGERTALDYHVNRKIAMDLALLGFFFAVFLYHLAFFVMHPRETSFLFFALVCLSFAIRTPFMNEKIINLLVPDAPWEFSLRTLGSINILSPALLMLYLRSVFPDYVPWRAVAPYLAISLPFMGVHFFDIGYLAPAMYVLYLIAVLPMLAHAAYVSFRKGLRGGGGARVMAVGFFLCLVFGFYAMYQNWKSEDPAPMALSAFAALVLFQAVGLGQNYRDNLDERERLSARLAHSRAALAAQRKDLEINLHDSLGGALTDLKVLADRRLEDVQNRIAFDAGEFLQQLRERLNQMGRLFRDQLLFMEDLELTARDPVIGLHMVLLRRYADAEREIDFRMAADASSAFQAAMTDDRWRMDFLQLTRELCTNDLKYGGGESRWRFELAPNAETLTIRQSNRLRDDRGATDGRDAQSAEEATMAVRARDRVQIMGGTFQAEIVERQFSARVSLPLHHGPLAKRRVE